MDNIVLVVAVLGLGISIAAFVNSITINNKVARREELQEMKKRLALLEKRIDELFRSL